MPPRIFPSSFRQALSESHPSRPHGRLGQSSGRQGSRRLGGIITKPSRSSPGKATPPTSSRVLGAAQPVGLANPEWAGTRYYCRGSPGERAGPRHSQRGRFTVEGMGKLSACLTQAAIAALSESVLSKHQRGGIELGADAECVRRIVSRGRSRTRLRSSPSSRRCCGTSPNGSGGRDAGPMRLPL